MSDPNAPHLAPVPESAPATPSPPPRVKTKVKKLRLLAILVPLALLAVVSTVFGMMMAVASDLPALEQLPQVAKRKNSVLTDIRGTRLTTLTSNQGRIIVTGDQIGAYAKYAVIAVEDQRFYENSGVDLRGIGRAFYQDVVQRRQAQGGSTIAQQFVKNALQAQSKRTVFEKLREAAMAYHLTRKWSKERILTEYLNTVYFGNGAYGIEAAARTYFSADPNHKGCGTPGNTMCAAQLTPAESALLAAIIASPSRFDPVAHPGAAMGRRNLVLKKMLEQKRISEPVYEDAIREPLYSAITPPHVDTLGGLGVLRVVGAPEPRRPGRAAEGVRGQPATCRRRSTSTCRRPRSRPSTTTCPGRAARPRRSWRSTTRPARSARWSAGATTTRRRSTSPRRASVSRAPRSSPSSWPRRCARASGPGRSSRRASASSACTRAAARCSSSTTSRTSTPASRRSPTR